MLRGQEVFKLDELEVVRLSTLVGAPLLVVAAMRQDRRCMPVTKSAATKEASRLASSCSDETCMTSSNTCPPTSLHHCCTLTKISCSCSCSSRCFSKHISWQNPESTSSFICRLPQRARIKGSHSIRRIADTRHSQYHLKTRWEPIECDRESHLYALEGPSHWYVIITNNTLTRPAIHHVISASSRSSNQTSTTCLSSRSTTPLHS